MIQTEPFHYYLQITLAGCTFSNMLSRIASFELAGLNLGQYNMHSFYTVSQTSLM